MVCVEVCADAGVDVCLCMHEQHQRVRACWCCLVCVDECWCVLVYGGVCCCVR